MRKIRQKIEKRERNEEYAKKFKVKKVKGKGKKTPTFANWCRTAGHPPNCQCVYPLRSEIPTSGGNRR